MHSSRIELPTDIASWLKEYIVSLYTELESQEAIISEHQAKEEVLQQENASLRFQLNYYIQQRYSKKGDQVPDTQLRLFDEPEEAEETETPEQPVTETITVESHERKIGRKPFPKDLPRESIVIDLKEDEKVCACGHELHRIGEDISEKLDIIPAQVRVIEVIRPKYGCRACEMGVQQKALPATPLPKTLATPGTLAHIIVSKYSDHLPLYRQETIFQRMGIDLPRNTLCEWVLSCSDLFQPLWQLLKIDLQQSLYIQADETPVTVLQQPKGCSNRHYMWCYLGWHQEKPIVLYDYHATRSGQVVQDFLKDFKGLLQTDGYSGYNQLSNITHGACWAHARRKFVEIVKNVSKPGIAKQAIEWIQQLYAIEKHAREHHFSHEQLL